MFFATGMMRGGIFWPFKTWSIDVDFDTPGNSSISNPTNRTTNLLILLFSIEKDAFQPGVGAKIDSIGGVISYGELQMLNTILSS
jgi:hypothetical protein